MSYNINLGGWNSIFAVPSRVVDEDLKLASAYQLKVLLYLLRHSNESLTKEQIGQSLAMHPDDVSDSLTYWIEKGLLVERENELVPSEAAVTAEPTQQKEITAQNTVAENSANTQEKATEKPQPKQRAMSRPQRPDSFFVAKRLENDSSLAALMDEAQIILGKPLSSGDTATLVMLHDTDGLPVDVLIMLMQYCMSMGKGNMRAIERLGIAWASEEIFTLEAAEEKIKQSKQRYNAWGIVSSTFGVKNIGSPTKQQLEYAEKWLNVWGFTTDMLREAYELCVDSKGEMNLRYIDGILKRWNADNIKCLEDIEKSESKRAKKGKSTTKRGDSENASYDLSEFEQSSIFDD